MSKKTLTFIIVTALLGMASCSEDDITPSADNRLVEFPQGNNNYDAEISQIYERYGTQMLYRFNDAMFRWQVTDRLGYVSRPAGEQYVGNAIKFIKENCFRFFDLKRYGMPRIEHILIGESGTATRYVLEERDPAYCVPLPDNALEHNENLVQNPLANRRVGVQQ